MTYLAVFLFGSFLFVLIIVWSLIEFYTELKRIEQFD